MKKIKILLVDDHQIVREGLKKMMSDEPDIDIIGSVSDAIAAIDFIKNNSTDIVIADLSMPGISGIELTSRLKEIAPDVKVLILSMFNNEDYVFSAINAGAKGYLPKQDSTTDVLLDAVRSIFSGDVYFSPSVSKIIMKSYVSNAKHTGSSDSLKRHSLTTREKEILKLYVEGFSNDEIAEKLHISNRTVKTHKNNIMQKYNFKSTVEMIKFALRTNIAEN